MKTADISTGVSNKHRGSRNLPLYLWYTYSVFTLGCFQLGLHEFYYPLRISDYIALYIYLAAIHVAVYLGYTRGMQYSSVVLFNPYSIQRHSYIACVGASAFVVTMLILLQSRGMTWTKGIEDLNDVRDLSNIEYAGSAWNHLIVPLSIFVMPMIAITFGYWDRVRNISRIWALSICALILLMAVNGGNRSSVYGVVTTFAVSYTLAFQARRVKGRIWTLLPAICAFIIVFIVYSNWIILDRHKVDRDIDYIHWTSQSAELRSTINVEHPVIQYVPKVFAPSIVQGVFYFGHGYNNLAYSLLKGNEGWGFGFGHSSFLVRNLAKITGDDALAFSKPFRMQRDDAASSSWWYTAYMWIASDTTYLGSIVFFYIISFLFGVAWRTCLTGYNGIAMWVLAWIGSAFLLVHNTFIVADYASWFSFWGTLLIFVLQLRRTLG